MSLFEYGFLAVSSLFAIINAIAAVPTFLTMTSDNTVEEKISMAQTACLVCAATLAVFAFLGRWIFQIFSITMPAFQIAGGVVLLMMAMDMLRARRSQVQETEEEKEAGMGKADIAVTPLAIPMLSGPGAISTVIVLSGKIVDWTYGVTLLVAIILSSLASFSVLALSAKGARGLSPIAMRVATRLMGLLLIAIAVQFILSALKETLIR